MPEKFKLFNVVPDSTKEEALNPTSNLIGQAFRGIAHKLLDPLVKYNIVKDIELENYANKIRHKTSNIPIEYRDDSKLGLTYKAVEDSVYQLNSEQLREMFSNLIAATVDDRINEEIKPSFSSILKDLSPFEATLFETIYRENTLAIIAVRIENEKSGKGLDLFNNIILMEDYEINEPSSLEILQRFGLIEIKPTQYPVSEKYIKRYNEFENSQIYQEIKSEHKLPIERPEATLDTIKLVKGSIKISSLGKMFGRIVISD